jgi:diacylglycerol kinase (ATP)
MKNVAVIAHIGKSFGGGLTELRQLLKEAGCSDPIWYEIDKSRKAPKRVRRAVAAGAELVLVWGGDGMVQRALDALPQEDAPTIAVLPAGTANLFATNLGIPKDLPAAVDTALFGTDRVLDVGKINGERFGVMAGVGFDARMIAEADKGLKQRVGRAAYVWTGLKATRAARQDLAVTVDDVQWFRGPASCVLIGNLGTVVGGLAAFDDARPDDGRLEVGVVTAKGPVQWARVVGRMAVGRSDVSKLVHMTNGERIDVRLSRKTPYELDGGDRPATKRLRIVVQPEAITVRVPPDAPGDGDRLTDGP